MKQFLLLSLMLGIISLSYGQYDSATTVRRSLRLRLSGWQSPDCRYHAFLYRKSGDLHPRKRSLETTLNAN